MEPTRLLGRLADDLLEEGSGRGRRDGRRRRGRRRPRRRVGLVVVEPPGEPGELVGVVGQVDPAVRLWTIRSRLSTVRKKS